MLIALVLVRHRRAVSDPPDAIILLTIDTLRSDALGFAGNPEANTPFLDRLATRSRVFTNAHAHNVVTLPSHVNILTGLYPYQHGVRDNAGYRLAPEHQTIAPLLKKAGYATGAFVGAYPLDARYGLTPGFDVYDDHYPEGKGKLEFRIAERPAEEVLTAARRWWDSQSGKRFMWIHLYDPHAPYRPPPTPERRQTANAYLGEVAYVDAALEKILGTIVDSSGDVLFIMTADHGESLGEHGELTHGLFTYEAALKVPLLVYERNVVDAGHDDRPVRHIDIAPTILGRANAEVPADRPGRSLLEPDAKRPSYFEALSASINRGWAPLVGLIDEGHKYIDLPLPELYDLEDDPGETKNLVGVERRVVTQLRNELATTAPSRASPRESISTEQKTQLLSLGYLSGSVAAKQYGPEDDPKKLIAIDNQIHRMIEAYQLGQHEQAVKLAQDIVAREPGMPLGREMLSFMLQQTERSDDAIATLRDAIGHGTSTDGMKIRLGLMLSESGRAKEAVEVLAPYSNSEDVELLNAYGIALADVGRAAEATREFKRVLELDATNATAYQNLGIVELRAGRLNEAERFLNKALNLDPQLPLALNTLGVVYARSGRPQQAIEVWTRAVDAEPKLYDALFNLAVVAGQEKRWDVAERALSRFIEIAPEKRYGRDVAQARQMLLQIERRKLSALQKTPS